jgi:hypothetical protein
VRAHGEARLGLVFVLVPGTEAKKIERVGNGVMDIDPGFENLLTTSEGEVIEHPPEFEQAQRRLAQAQRGHRKLAALISERISNRRLTGPQGPLPVSKETLDVCGVWKLPSWRRQCRAEHAPGWVGSALEDHARA